MPISIPKRVERVFRLTVMDPNGDGVVRFRQATNGDVEALEQLRPPVRQHPDRSIDIDLRRSAFEAEKVRLTLVQCDIKDQAGKTEAFTEGMSKEAFMKNWGLLTVDMADELLAKCFQMNPFWSEGFVDTKYMEDEEKDGLEEEGDDETPPSSESESSA